MEYILGTKRRLYESLEITKARIPEICDLFNLVIRSHFVSGPESLNCDFQKHLFFFSPLVSEKGKLERPGVA